MITRARTNHTIDFRMILLLSGRKWERTVFTLYEYKRGRNFNSQIVAVSSTYVCMFTTKRGTRIVIIYKALENRRFLGTGRRCINNWECLRIPQWTGIRRKSLGTWITEQCRRGMLCIVGEPQIARRERNWEDSDLISPSRRPE